jgi:hypothetical protein
MRIDVLPDGPPSQRRHALGDEVVTVRPARPEDAGRIGAYIRGLSFISRYTIDLIQATRPKDRIRNNAGALIERPTLFAHKPMHDRERDCVL